jgi:hypothetical protein
MPFPSLHPCVSQVSPGRGPYNIDEHGNAVGTPLQRACIEEGGRPLNLQ